MGKLELSSDVTKKEYRNAMNVMLMEKDDFNKKILNFDNLQKHYGGNGNKSWVVAPLKDLLDKGAKLYPDESCSLRLGQPFIITLPETTKVNVDIYPVSKKQISLIWMGTQHKADAPKIYRGLIGIKLRK